MVNRTSRNLDTIPEYKDRAESVISHDHDDPDGLDIARDPPQKRSNFQN